MKLKGCLLGRIEASCRATPTMHSIQFSVPARTQIIQHVAWSVPYFVIVELCTRCQSCDHHLYVIQRIFVLNRATKCHLKFDSAFPTKQDVKHVPCKNRCGPKASTEYPRRVLCLWKNNPRWFPSMDDSKSWSPCRCHGQRCKQQRPSNVTRT